MARSIHEGMGQAVAQRTILRRKPDGGWEDWGDVAKRVALGNCLLRPEDGDEERERLERHIASGVLLMSGRHLQHGDETQPTRSMEVFSNCSTSCTSFASFLLLMSGSGVGRCYDDDMMLVDWDNAPALRCVLSESRSDFDYSAHESVRDARHKYGSGKGVTWLEVGDTREGWAKAVEVWEVMAFEKIHKDELLVLDFSNVRTKGTPIVGMQGRPASGPVPLMNAFGKASSLRGSGLSRWRQAMYVDHYFAECVLVGGARRSARMSTKSWRDKSVLEFVTVKRPVEYDGKGGKEILALRNGLAVKPQGFLWSSNNSVMVDAEFWELVSGASVVPLARHARDVFALVTEASYADGTGEPGFINVDKLECKRDGLDALRGSNVIRSNRYTVEEDTRVYLSRLLRAAKKKPYFMTTNPCGEVNLAVWGAFCVIGDTVPFHAESLEEAEDAVRAMTRALIRVNLMDSIYGVEVERTNRIGVGITGVHEFAWKFFGFAFRDLIDEAKSQPFWLTLSRFKRAVQDEAKAYSKLLGVNTPHTDMVVKPSGSVSKLFGLTEGWHLPAMAWYLRWVQFSIDDPLVETYRDSGYPVRELVKYRNTVIVGFPTSPVLSTLGLGDKLVTAAQATPEEQYRWLMLCEKYWLRGVDDEGIPLANDTGSQASYTLKYNPKVVDYESFRRTLLEYQPLVKCCSVMPQEDASSYEYLPEESVTKAEYEAVAAQIEAATRGKSLPEDVDFAHVGCAGGACPVDFDKPEREGAA